MCLVRFVLTAISASALGFGQAQVSSGDIRGTVTDPTGAVIARANVAASDADRGIERSVLTDAEGTYSLRLLPPGTYKVRIEAPGFAAKTVEGVLVHVGETVVLRMQLDIGAAATTQVEVGAETPVVETYRSQQASTIESARIANLPINRRNYLAFALLTPGVVETNDMVDGTDYRVVQAPQSGLSFGAGNGRGNGFLLDGIENSYNSGGVRPSLSQEAVQEFQINRNTYSAELGGAVGGVINIVSKTGSNTFHGGAFAFLRHRDVQARNYFDPGKSAFTRVQSGASAGGPIKRNQSYFFASLERLDRHETAFVPILQDRSAFGRLTPPQQELVNFFNGSGSPVLRGLGRAMEQALVPGNNPRTVALFDRNSGNFPFAEDETQGSLRLDHRLSQRQNLFFRGNLTKDFDQNAQFGALIAFNRGRSLDVLDGSLVMAHNFVIGPSAIVETRAAFGYSHLDVIPTDPYGPSLDITGFGSFGREIFLPSRIIERHFQLQQVWSTSRNRHEVKFGFDVNPVRDAVRSETFFAGRFSFGSRVPLGVVLNRATGNPNLTAELAQTLVAAGRQSLIGNLSSPLSSLQAFNLGLPDFYQQGFGDPNWLGWSKRNSVFVQDSWHVSNSLTVNAGLRYELEVNPRPVPIDPNNAAPRFGFAWNPSGSGKTVVRGGYGLYYSPVDLQVANVADTLAGNQIPQVFVPLTGIPGLSNPRTGLPLTSSDIYQTLAAQGVLGARSITRGDLAQFGLQPAARAPFSVVFGIVPDYVSPYAHQASFEVERGFGYWAVSAGYNFNRAAHLVRILDRNLFYAGRRPDGNPVFGFRAPLLSQYNVFESTANSFYHAMILQASRRFSRNFSLNVHYTLSKSIDEVTDFNTDFEPHDQLNARAERALSSFDQRHRFVANGIWQMAGFTFSPVLVAASARPFNVLAGVDNLGDRHSTTHRPLGAGRNIGRGPNYFTIDARLSRRFRLGKSEQGNLEIIAEGFNLLNRTNFRTVNNTVGDVAVQDLPRPLTGRRGSPVEPLSFTSTFDPRQIQFGLRLNF